jgi:hypothetical protein
MPAKAVSLIASSEAPFTWYVRVFQVRVNEEGIPYWFECDPIPGCPPPTPVTWDPGTPPIKSQYLLSLVMSYGQMLNLPVLQNLYHGCTDQINLSDLELLSCTLSENGG